MTKPIKISTALLREARLKLEQLALARGLDPIISSLFQLHCLLKDIEGGLPAKKSPNQE